MKINQSEYDQPGGVPRLDSSGKIQTSQLSTEADLPIGMIAAFGMETLSTGSNWLECDGSELPIADYQDLYAVIGSYFGLPDSPSNFKLPDLRGEFLRGWDHGRGRDPNAALRTRGDRVGSSQNDVVKKHNHPMGNGGGAQGYAALLDAQSWDTPGMYYNYYTQDFLRTGDTLQPYWYDNVPQGSETRPVNTAVMYCIKWR